MRGSEIPPEDWAVLVEDWEVLDLLSSLVDKSLVVYEEQPDGTGRYRLLETVRQYGRERLADSGEGEAAQGRHLAYYLALAEEAEPHLRGAEQVVWLNRLEAEHDNLRLALRLALETSDRDGRADAALSLCGKLFVFWSVRGHFAEGREWCAEALALPFPTSAPSEAVTALRAGVLHTAGSLAGQQGDYEAAHGFLEQSLTLFQEIGGKRGVAKTLFGLGNVAFSQGDYEEARGIYEQSRTLFQEIGGKRGVAIALSGLANLARNQGDYKSARSFCEQNLKLCQELGDKWGIASVLLGLGHIANTQSDDTTAQSFYEQGLTLCRELGDKQGVANALLGLAFVAENQGDYGAAHGFFERTLTISRELGSKQGMAYALEGLGNVADNQGDYEAARSFREQTLTLRQEMGDKRLVARTLSNLGKMAGKSAQWERRTRLYGAAEALRAAIGAPLVPGEQSDHDAAIAEARAALGEEAFAAAWDAGQAMTWEQAVEYALTAAPEDVG